MVGDQKGIQMAASRFDSALYKDLFHDAEIGRLLSDSAEVRAMLLVEGALAKAQGDLGLIPAESAAFINRSAMEVQIDPAGLSQLTGENAVCIPALVAAFRKAMEAPDHAQYLHWGATSQDIIDTGLVLRLRQMLDILETRLKSLIAGLGQLAEDHAETPMAAKTWGLVATPSSFGATVAQWGQPLIRHLDRLSELRPRLLVVSLSGASGTLSAMGDQGPEVRARLAQGLGLGDTGESWHANRDTMVELSDWLTGLCGSLAKMGEDLLIMTQSGLSEVVLTSGGASSTMPQKKNPVAPSVMVALARFATGLNANMHTANAHRQQRDGAAWLVEWLSLPLLLMSTGRALSLAADLSGQIAPDAATLRAQVEGGLGLAMAEALSFELARVMPRPEAQAETKALCKLAISEDIPLVDLAARQWPDIDWANVLKPEAQMGTAAEQARAFATRARSLTVAA